MNESDALGKMIAPGTRRKNIWRNGVLQIWITRACDKACFHCTQGSNLGGKPGMITVEQFAEAVDSLECGKPGGYFGVVGMFGGNPAQHPKFEELCSVMRAKVPFMQRGLWCNNPLGKGKAMSITFNPAVSNLNVHQDQQAYDEFAKDWPASRKVLKGLSTDSRHGPPYVAMSDIVKDESERWKLIADCDINKYWSAMIGVVNGNLRAFFCEIAAAQAMLHQNNKNWMGTGLPMPDTGLPVTVGWWRKPMSEFAEQVRVHCHACGIPLKGFGALANSGPAEQYSEVHAAIMKTKTPGRNTMMVTELVQLGEKYLHKATDYIENGSLQ
jgi:hypothetical protein